MLGIISAIGLVGLLVAFAYGISRNQSRTRREKERTDASAQAKIDSAPRQDRRG